MECVVQEGSDCKLDVGSPIRIYDEKPVEEETKPVANETKQEAPKPPPAPVKAPDPVPEPAPAAVETAATPAVPDLV